jgi:type IV secretion system protein VirB6
MTSCPTISDGAFLQSALSFVDCQAQTIGGQGYQALAAPGSSLSLMITGLLTLLIAFAGYRMLIGQTPELRDGILIVVKIGIVFALTTSWAAYRTLVYDVTLHAPAEIVASSQAPAGLPGARGDLIDRLARVDDAMIRLAQPRAAATAIAPSQRMSPTQPLEPATMFTPVALGTARLIYLTATLASYGVVRLVAGLLLALGPFFIAFLLFDGTRALFEGWVRGLAAAIVGSIAVAILLGIELALLEPWLAILVAKHEAGLGIESAPTELLVTSLAFGFVLLGGLAAAARIAVALRLPATRPSSAIFRSASTILVAEPRVHLSGGTVPSEQQSRTAAIVEAVQAAQRREATFSGAAPTSASGRAPAMAPARDRFETSSTPLGQTHRRRTQNRVSSSAGRRDKQQ